MNMFCCIRLTLIGQFRQFFLSFSFVSNLFFRGCDLWLVYATNCIPWLYHFLVNQSHNYLQCLKYANLTTILFTCSTGKDKAAWSAPSLYAASSTFLKAAIPHLLTQFPSQKCSTCCGAKQVWRSTTVCTNTLVSYIMDYSSAGQVIYSPIRKVCWQIAMMEAAF
jgi:hypothetical protein